VKKLVALLVLAILLALGSCSIPNPDARPAAAETALPAGTAA
jgi:hypothetical protein